jgi:hypothetical protein
LERRQVIPPFKVCELKFAGTFPNQNFAQSNRILEAYSKSGG